MGIRGSAPCRRLHTFHRSARRHGRYAPAQGHGALCHAHPVLSFRHVLYLHRLSEFGPEPASCGLAEHEVRRKCEKASFPHDDGLRSAFDHSCGSARHRHDDACGSACPQGKRMPAGMQHVRQSHDARPAHRLSDRRGGHSCRGIAQHADHRPAGKHGEREDQLF